MVKKAVIGAAVIAICSVALFVAAKVYYRYQFPFGAYHRCDKQLWFALREYAAAHGGRFPSGEATPEASLSLLGREYAYLLPRRDVPEEIVEQILAQGQLLGPDTWGRYIMRADFELTSDDLVAFVTAHNRRSPAIRRQTRRCLMAGVALLSVIPWVSYRRSTAMRHPVR